MQEDHDIEFCLGETYDAVSIFFFSKLSVEFELWSQPLLYLLPHLTHCGF